MSSQYRQQIDAWLKNQYFQADQVLDVGGGEKKASSVTNVTSNRYLVMDNVPGLKPDFLHDLNDFSPPQEVFATERNYMFDLIFCLHVFEYIWNPYNAVANLYSWLSPGGTLVVNFPFLYPIHNPVGIDYLRYTDEWIQKMFMERFKFQDIEIIQLNATTGLNELIGFYSREGMHYRKDDDTWQRIGFIVKAKK